jgi:hypothetical protein
MLAVSWADGVAQVVTFVIGALLVALMLGMARFTMHVRDSVRDQDKKLTSIDKAVNHTPAGEPRLYDLVVETAAKVEQMAENLKEHKASTNARFRTMQTSSSVQYIKLNESVLTLRDTVTDLHDKIDPPERPSPI